MGQQYPEQPVAAVAGVVIRGEGIGHGSVLLVRRAHPPSQGEWSLPGGVLELGETLEAGVAREVLEETGLRVEPVSVLEVLDHIVYDPAAEKSATIERIRFHYVLIDFFCRPIEGDAAGASDALEALWVGDRDLEQYGLSAKTLSVIRKGFRVFAEGT